MSKFNAYLLKSKNDNPSMFDHVLVDCIEASDLDDASEIFITKLIAPNIDNPSEFSVSVEIDENAIDNPTQKFVSFNEGLGPSFCVCIEGETPIHD